MVSPVKTMGHPQGRQSAAVNAHKDTLVRIVKSLMRALQERTGSPVRMVAASLEQQIVARVLVRQDTLVPTVKLHHHVQKDTICKTVKMVVLQTVSLDRAGVLVRLDTKVITAKRHLRVTRKTLALLVLSTASTEEHPREPQAPAHVSALQGTQVRCAAPQIRALQQRMVDHA
jgi:hypothetical protein